MDIVEKWILGHLPPGLKNESLDLFAEEYLDCLTVMAKGERGGPGKVFFRGRDLAQTFLAEGPLPVLLHSFGPASPGKKCPLTDNLIFCVYLER